MKTPIVWPVLGPTGVRGDTTVGRRLGKLGDFDGATPSIQRRNNRRGDVGPLHGCQVAERRNGVIHNLRRPTMSVAPGAITRIPVLAVTFRRGTTPTHLHPTRTGAVSCLQALNCRPISRPWLTNVASGATSALAARSSMRNIAPAHGISPRHWVQRHLTCWSLRPACCGYRTTPTYLAGRRSPGRRFTRRDGITRYLCRTSESG